MWFTCFLLIWHAPWNLRASWLSHASSKSTLLAAKLSTLEWSKPRSSEGLRRMLRVEKFKKGPNVVSNSSMKFQRVFMFNNSFRSKKHMFAVAATEKYIELSLLWSLQHVKTRCTSIWLTNKQRKPMPCQRGHVVNRSPAMFGAMLISKSPM